MYQQPINKILFKSLVITDFLFFKHTQLFLKTINNNNLKKIKNFQISLVDVFKGLKQLVRLIQNFKHSKIAFFISETYTRGLLKEIFNFYKISSQKIELDFNFKKKEVNPFQSKLLLFFGQYSWVSKNIFNMLLFRKLFLTQNFNLVINKKEVFSYLLQNDFTSFKKILFIGIFLSKLIK